MKLIFKKIFFCLPITLFSLPLFFTASCAPTLPNNVNFVGHRGLPSDPDVFENTLDSFKRAAEYDFFSAIETDIWPTSDHKLYCVHDSECFYGTNEKINLLSEAQVKTYKLHASKNYPRNNPGEFDHASWTKDYKAPTFLEYLDVCTKANKTAVIELKDDVVWTAQAPGVWTDENIDKIFTDITNSDIKENYIIISFDNALLEHIVSTRPEKKAKMQMLFDPVNPIEKYSKLEWFAQNGWNIDLGDSLSESTKDWGINLTQDDVDMFHKQNLEVNVWTVNTKERAIALSALGVDYITSDYKLF